MVPRDWRLAGQRPEKRSPGRSLLLVPGFYPVRSRMQAVTDFGTPQKYGSYMPLRQVQLETAIPGLWEAIGRTFSPARLQLYLNACGFKKDVALNLYLWNIRVSQSFYFPIQTLEISLRNTTHLILQELWESDWHLSLEFRKILTKERIGNLEEVKARIEKRSLPFTVDQVIATMSFSFWVFLLDRRYNPTIWSTHLRRAFPMLPRRKERQYDALNRVLALRNAISHHEALIGANLMRDYEDILNLLGWICPRTKEWMVQHSSVLATLQQRPKV
jgi:hypothetical protein